jgi:hypothetical protein
MKPDTYTKTILTIVALLLGVIALRPLIHPDTTASAQAQHERAATASKPAPESAKTGWEYKLIDVSRPGGFGLQDYNEMDEDGQKIPGVDWLSRSEQLGMLGWELVSVTPASNVTGQNFAGDTSEMLFMFKRPLH